MLQVSRYYDTNKVSEYEWNVKWHLSKWVCPLNERHRRIQIIQLDLLQYSIFLQNMNINNLSIITYFRSYDIRQIENNKCFKNAIVKKLFRIKIWKTCILYSFFFWPLKGVTGSLPKTYLYVCIYIQHNKDLVKRMSF